MTAVLKHELRGYFHSMLAYLFTAFFLVFVGVGAMIYNIGASVANFEYVLSFVCIGMVVIIPVLTMRSLAEERKQKTDQLLFSLPLRTSDIIFGKYIALLIVFSFPMIIICFYPLIFSAFGDVYLLSSYGSIFGFYLMCAALIAVGMFISSLTDNQGIAAGAGIVIMLFNYFSVKLAEYVSTNSIGTLAVFCAIGILLGLLAEHITGNENLGTIISIVLVIVSGLLYFFGNGILDGLLPKIMSALSLFDHFNVIINGVFDMRSIVFFISVAVFFVFLSVQSLEKRRYN